MTNTEGCIYLEYTESAMVHIIYIPWCVGGTRISLYTKWFTSCKLTFEFEKQASLDFECMVYIFGTLLKLQMTDSTHKQGNFCSPRKALIVMRKGAI